MGAHTTNDRQAGAAHRCPLAAAAAGSAGECEAGAKRGPAVLPTRVMGHHSGAGPSGSRRGRAARGLVLGGVLLLGLAGGVAGRVSPAFSDSASMLLRSAQGPAETSSRPVSGAVASAVRVRKGGDLAPPLMAGNRAGVLEPVKAPANNKKGGGDNRDREMGAAEALLRQLRAPQRGDAEGSAVSSDVEDSEDVVSHAISSWTKGTKQQQRRAPPGSLGLESGVSMMPHPLKAYRGGEDVALEVTIEGHTVIGVFDGVGGWAELGVDPALYARRMADLVRMEFERNPGMALLHEKPLVDLLQAAYDELEAAELPGSCTASLALLTSEGQLHVLNVGDSGIQLIRGGKSVFRTREQQHYFNCPFQLGMGSDDQPTDGDYYVVEDVEEGDVLVAATDGTWDNVFADDVVDLVSRGGPAGEVARRVAALSHEHGQDPGYMSPFAVNSAQQGHPYRGGKLDDVTVVVSRIGSAVSSSRGAGGRALAEEELVTSASCESVEE